MKASVPKLFDCPGSINNTPLPEGADQRGLKRPLVKLTTPRVCYPSVCKRGRLATTSETYNTVGSLPMGWRPARTSAWKAWFRRLRAGLSTCAQKKTITPLQPWIQPIHPRSWFSRATTPHPKGSGAQDAPGTRPPAWENRTAIGPDQTANQRVLEPTTNGSGSSAVPKPARQQPDPRSSGWLPGQPRSGPWQHSED